MIYRTYRCGDCETIWEYHHDSGDEPPPDCPTCSKVLQWQPRSFNTTGVKSKAMDYAQKVMEEDYGLSNFKDNNREGDVGIIRNVETRAETEKVEREVREMVAQTDNPAVKAFWGDAQGAPAALGTVPAQNMIAAAKIGPQGVDPDAPAAQGRERR